MTTGTGICGRRAGVLTAGLALLAGWGLGVERAGADGAIEVIRPPAEPRRAVERPRRRPRRLPAEPSRTGLTGPGRSVPLTLPRGYEPRPAAPEPLPPENAVLVDRLCRLQQDADSPYPLAVFGAPGEGEAPRPRRLLLCRLVEQMERAAAGDPDVRFRLSGETFVYKRTLYLLVTHVTILRPGDGRRAADVRPPAGAEGTAGDGAHEAPAEGGEIVVREEGQAGADGGAAGPADEPSAEDVMGELMKDRPGEPVLTPVLPEAQKLQPAPSVAPAAGPPLPSGRQDMVVDRRVRVVPPADEGHWMARFIADNTLQEPPMRLLPCWRLEVAEAFRIERAREGRTVAFRVSGQVTYYRGRRYLLLRKLLPARSLGMP